MLIVGSIDECMQFYENAFTDHIDFATQLVSNFILATCPISLFMKLDIIFMMFYIHLLDCTGWAITTMILRLNNIEWKHHYYGVHWLRPSFFP